MHNTQTDYAMQTARYDAAMSLFSSKSAHLVYPGDAECPEWAKVFDAEEVIRAECHLDTLWDLRTESEDRLIAWQLGRARRYSRGIPEWLNSITYLESNAWKPKVRKQLLDLAMRLDAPAIAAAS